MNRVKTLSQQIYNDLKLGKRPRIPLDDSAIQEVEQAWQLAGSEKELLDVLAILAHSADRLSAFDELLAQSFDRFELSEEGLILTLSTCQYQIVDRCQRQGDDLPPALIGALKKAFSRPEKLFLLQLLELIDDIGMRGKRFLPELQNLAQATPWGLHPTTRKSKKLLARLIERHE